MDPSKFVLDRIKGFRGWFVSRSKKQKVFILLVVLYFATPGVAQSIGGGFESTTAEWNRISWDEYTDTAGNVWPEYEKDVDFLAGEWDGNERFGVPSATVSNWARYRMETDQPKFDRNLETHEFQVNGSYVYDENGVIIGRDLRDYEWAIDIYTVIVSISTVAAYGDYACDGATFWLRFQNNAFTVFENADDAAGYVIQAHVASYTYTENHPNHIVLPTQGAYEIRFVGENVVDPPEAFEDNKDIDFEALRPFSDVEIPFKIVDLSPQIGGADCTVNILIELNVLRAGVWNFVLDYESGGINRNATEGSAGFFGTIMNSLAAGAEWWLDTTGDFLGDLGLSLILPLALLAIAVLVILKLAPKLIGSIYRRVRGK